MTNLNLQLFNDNWKELEQYKNNEAKLDNFASHLIANKPSLAKYRRKIVLFLQKIDYVDPLFNGEIGEGKLEVDGVSCCMLWNAAKNKSGYGSFCVENKPNKKTIHTHRFMLFLIDPDFELDDLTSQALHRCDNPSCVNPNHLRPGTAQDNMDDKVNKGRSITGINHHSAILTDDQVWAIRDDIRVNAVIAIEYGVNEATISKIKRGERKLTDPTKSLPKNQNPLMSLESKTIKVTKEVANEIIRLKATGEYYQKELAIIFSISESVISRILKGKSLKRFE